VFGLNWDVIWRYREQFLSGLALGLKLAVIGLAFACVIGIIVAFARTSRYRWLSGAAGAYVEFIRNIPLLLILFFLYFGLPMWAYSAVPHNVADLLVMDGDNTAIVALAIYGGAYLAEVFRAGILSVSRSFVEAGRSLGLSAGRPSATSHCRSCFGLSCLRSATRSSPFSRTPRWPWPLPYRS